MSAKPDNLTLKTRWILRRNAILGSAAFQRWAARTPLVRRIARARAAAQFDLIAGFVYSQVLAAFVQASLIEFLNGDFRSFDELVEFTGLSPHATERLLKAGASLQIAESPQPGYWTLGEAGAPLSANEGAMAMIRHHHLLYRDLAEPLSLLAKNRREETNLSAYWTYASKDDSQAEAAGYSALMAATQPMVSQQIIDAYDFSAHKHMLDIGGGSGAFSRAISAAAPGLHLGIFDLPDVIAEARKRLEDQSGPAIELHPGSFKEDAIPGGYDLITLVRILHDHDDDIVRALLAKIYEALPSGGRLLVIEPMADSASAKRMGDAYFGFYLWAMGSGRPRSEKETTDMLTNVGFRSIKTVKTALPIITNALVAIK